MFSSTYSFLRGLDWQSESNAHYLNIMDDLKTMMDNLPIADINNQVNEFIHSGENNDNKTN